MILPAANGSAQSLFTNLLPETVFYGQGPDNKSFTLSGNMSAFSSLAGKSGWDLYLVKKGGGDQDQVRIDKRTSPSWAISTTHPPSRPPRNCPWAPTKPPNLPIHRDRVGGRLRSEPSTGRTVTASADQRYRSRSYGIIALEVLRRYTLPLRRPQ